MRKGKRSQSSLPVSVKIKCSTILVQPIFLRDKKGQKMEFMFADFWKTLKPEKMFMKVYGALQVKNAKLIAEQLLPRN